MPQLDIQPLLPAHEDNLLYVWERLQGIKAGHEKARVENGVETALEDCFPANVLSFVGWVFAPGSMALTVGPSAAPVGLFVINGIQEDSAFCHAFFWDTESSTYAERVEAGQTVALTMFNQIKVHRLQTLTPCCNPAARVYLRDLGFRKEGTLQEAVKIRGEWEDAWLSSMLRRDLDKVLSSKVDAPAPLVAEADPSIALV